MFENRVLKRIFGLKRKGVVTDWQKLNDKELHNLYPLPKIIRMIRSRRVT
jgi:hypothetical protein